MAVGTCPPSLAHSHNLGAFSSCHYMDHAAGVMTSVMTPAADEARRAQRQQGSTRRFWRGGLIFPENGVVCRQG